MTPNVNNMNLKQQIKRILAEEYSQKNIRFQNLSKELGLDEAVHIAGGLREYANLAYNGDIKELFKNENLEPYTITRDTKPNMYIHELIVDDLNLEDYFPNGEKLADLISFALFDKDVVTNGNNSYAYPEAQEA